MLWFSIIAISFCFIENFPDVRWWKEVTFPQQMMFLVSFCAKSFYDFNVRLFKFNRNVGSTKMKDGAPIDLFFKLCAKKRNMYLCHRPLNNVLSYTIKRTCSRWPREYQLFIKCLTKSSWIKDQMAFSSDEKFPFPKKYLQYFFLENFA